MDVCVCLGCDCQLRSLLLRPVAPALARLPSRLARHSCLICKHRPGATGRSSSLRSWQSHKTQTHTFTHMGLNMHAQALKWRRSRKNWSRQPLSTLVCMGPNSHLLAGRATETQQETPEQAAKRFAAEDEAKRAAIRAMGTMVTPENFRQWKTRFDAEQAAVGAQRCTLLCLLLCCAVLCCAPRTIVTRKCFW